MVCEFYKQLLQFVVDLKHQFDCDLYFEIHDIIYRNQSIHMYQNILNFVLIKVELVFHQDQNLFQNLQLNH